MAIIDPAGLFQGDRLSRCSDEAQLYWPRYYLASNSIARLELNYDNLCSTAFKSLRTRPTREQFAAHIREYNENYLLFIYQSKGSVWGQWATDKRNLPRFSTRDARRSPAPPEQEFAKWCDEYATIKATERAKEFLDLLHKNGKVPAIHSESAEITESLPEITVNSENSQRVTETHGDSPRGVGVGVGVGEGKTKIKNKNQKPSAKSAEAKVPDPRHAPVRDYIKRCIEHATNLHPAPWDGRDGKSLDSLLSKNPSWSTDVFVGLVKARFRSEGIPRGDPAHIWLPTLAKFANGPLDRFGKVMESVKPDEKVKPISAAEEVRRQLQER